MRCEGGEGWVLRSSSHDWVLRAGAAAYFDCDSAVLATDGDLAPTAADVAHKLNVTILRIPAAELRTPTRERSATKPAGAQEETFESIWEQYVMPLEGATLRRPDGSTNEIVRVDWSGVERITSNGKKQLIKIEIFRKTIHHLLKHGSITRAQINDEYAERASSGVVLILSHTPVFETTDHPTGLRLVPSYSPAC